MNTVMTEGMLETIAERFRALGEPMRLRILQDLLDGESSVNTLASRLETTQSNTSRHLKALFDAGLVGRRKEGLEAFYYVADPVVKKLCHLMCQREEQRAEAYLAALPGRK